MGRAKPRAPLLFTPGQRREDAARGCNGRSAGLVVGSGWKSQEQTANRPPSSALLVYRDEFALLAQIPGKWGLGLRDQRRRIS